MCQRIFIIYRALNIKSPFVTKERCRICAELTTLLDVGAMHFFDAEGGFLSKGIDFSAAI